LTVSALLWPLITQEFSIWRAQSAFEAKTSETKLRGKTANQVIGLLGAPNRRRCRDEDLAISVGRDRIPR
jgi:hypothetical protein